MLSFLLAVLDLFGLVVVATLILAPLAAGAGYVDVGAATTMLSL